MQEVATAEAVQEGVSAQGPPVSYAAAIDKSWPLLPSLSSTVAVAAATDQELDEVCLKSQKALPKTFVRLSKEARASEDAAGGALQMWSAGTSIGECWSPGFPPSPQPVALRRKKGRRPSHERHQRTWLRCSSGTRILSAGFL